MLTQDDSRMTPEWLQDDSRMTPGWLQDDFRMTSGWLQDDSRMTPGWLQDYFRMTSGWLQDDLFIMTQATWTENIFSFVLIIASPSCSKPQWANFVCTGWVLVPKLGPLRGIPYPVRGYDHPAVKVLNPNQKFILISQQPLHRSLSSFFLCHIWNFSVLRQPWYLLNPAFITHKHLIFQGQPSCQVVIHLTP